MFLRKIFAFVKRDILIETSYRFNFLVHLLGIIFLILTFYFIARLFGQAAVPYLSDYGGDYFSFVLIGIAFSNYLTTGLSGFAQNLRQEQLTGTLETMLATPTKAYIIILFSSLWNFIYTTFEIVIYLFVGILFFGAKIVQPNFIAVLIIVILTVISFSSLGIISAGFIIIFKRGDPVNWAIMNAFQLLGGVYFPIAILPNWLEKFSLFLPITYSLNSLRQTLLQGYSFKKLLPDLSVLTLFVVILLPLSIVFFNYAIKRAKREGTLSHY